MKLVLTAVEVEAMKEAFGGEFTKTVESKFGSKVITENGDMLVIINPEMISDVLRIFVRIQPTIMAMVAMVKTLCNQLSDLGDSFEDKWLK